MEPKFPHPFKNKSKTIDIPKEKLDDVNELFNWIRKQPRFPNYTKNHAHQFLHACIWDMVAAKKALQKYCSIHANSPDIFGDRDPLSVGMQYVFDMTHMVALPEKTPEGYTILIYRLADTDPSKMHFGEAVKTFCMFNDVIISEDGLCEGYVVVFDMKGLRLGHLARVQLGPLKTFMHYIQEAHPVRLKKVYVVHAASFINHCLALVKPLIKSELLSLLHFTTEGPLEIFSKNVLPEDYGGTLKSIASYNAEQRKLIETEYREWLIDSSCLKEVPKIKAEDVKSIDKAPIKSLRALEID